MWYINIQWSITQLSKEWNLSICNKMKGYYAKWNKSEKDECLWFHSYVKSKNKRTDIAKQTIIEKIDNIFSHW